jgi:hypothetical protein
MPSTHDAVPCATCGQVVLWTTTARGERMPIDGEPDPEGRTAVHRDATGRLRSRGLTRERATLEGAEWSATCHFATCTASPGTPGRGGEGRRPLPRLIRPPTGRPR